MTHYNTLNTLFKGENKPKTILTLLLYLLMLAYGISFTMIGPLMPILLDQYGINMSQGGLAVAFQNIGGIAAIALGSFLADFARKSRLICGAFAVYTITLLLSSTSPSYAILLGIFLILGASTKFLDAMLSAFVSDLHPERRGLFLNLLHATFGVGAFIGPLFASLIIKSGMHWNIAFLILAAICLIIIIAYIMTIKNYAEEKVANVSSESISYKRLFTSPRMVVLCLLILFYSSHQAIISSWLPTYMEKSLKTGSILASFASSMFWLGIIIGRLLCSVISSKLSTKSIMLYGCLSGGLVLSTGFIINEPIVICITAGLTGIFTGCIIPFTITYACSLYPNNSGSATSLLYFYMSVAWILFPWLSGKTAETAFQPTMLYTGLILFVIAILIIPLPGAKRNEKK